MALIAAKGMTNSWSFECSHTSRIPTNQEFVNLDASNCLHTVRFETEGLALKSSLLHRRHETKNDFELTRGFKVLDRLNRLLGLRARPIVSNAVRKLSDSLVTGHGIRWGAFEFLALLFNDSTVLQVRTRNDPSFVESLWDLVVANGLHSRKHRFDCR